MVEITIAFTISASTVKLSTVISVNEPNFFQTASFSSKRNIDNQFTVFYVTKYFLPTHCECNPVISILNAGNVIYKGVV